MSIRALTLNDLELLIRLRLDYFRQDDDPPTEEMENTLKEQLRVYYTKHLPLGDFLALVAEVQGEVAATAFLIMGERPANPAFPTGKTGTVFNVLTYPAHRRKGYASRLIAELMEQAAVRGVTYVDLLATQDGKPVYEKLGFKVARYTAMNLRLGTSCSPPIIRIE